MTPHVDVILLTVNQNETQALLQAFEEATGSPATPISVEERVYRDLGSVNGTKVVHALSEIGAGAAQQTLDKAIRALKPGAVIAVGIAFGVNEKKQEIGDILISKQLSLYELQRTGPEIILRGDKPHASTRLINFFEGVAQSSWQGLQVRPGVILTGEKLVDNLDYREQLLQFEPEAIGGEMEGAGLYATCHDHNVDWIVIKAICDWGDGDKARNKQQRQKKAAASAADFVVFALQQAQLQYPPKLNVVEPEARPAPIRPLLRDLERALNGGDLTNSELGGDVLATLRVERKLELAKPFDSKWIISGIQQGDAYFAPIWLSAGQRDWQRDFAKPATPILVGVAWSLKPSSAAQAITMRLCNLVAERLHLELVWPDDPDETNDLKNSIYRSCLSADALECDDVLVELQGLTVIGPK